MTASDTRSASRGVVRRVNAIPGDEKRKKTHSGRGTHMKKTTDE